MKAPLIQSSLTCAALLVLSSFAQEPPPANQPPPPPPGEQRPGAHSPHHRPDALGRGPERHRGPAQPPRRHDGAAAPGWQRALKPTPYMGVVTFSLPPAMSAQLSLPEGFGLLVDNVLPDSPAQTAGLQKYDVLKLFNDQQLVTPGQLAALVRHAGKDTEVSLTVLRKGQEEKVTLKVGEKMLPETPGAFSPDMMRKPLSPEFRERIEQFRRNHPRGHGTRQPAGPQDAQKRMEALQQKLQEYQQAVRKWHEDVRRWQEKREGEVPPPPQAPKLDAPPTPPSDSSAVQPTDILRDIRPGRAVQVRGEWSDGTSRWDASRARVKMRIPEGEMELAVVDGRRTLEARDASGKTVFTGAVDTPEQRDNIPEPFRSKLSALETPPEGAFRPESPEPRADLDGTPEQPAAIQ